jgi:hypothetical protein
MKYQVLKIMMSAIYRQMQTRNQIRPPSNRGIKYARNYLLQAAREL